MTIRSKQDRTYKALSPQVQWTGWAARSFARDADRDRIETILVMQPPEFEEALLTLPILRPLRRTFPNATITVVAGEETANALAGHPEIDVILARRDSNSQPLNCPIKYARLLWRIWNIKADLLIDLNSSNCIDGFLGLVSCAKHKICYDLQIQNSWDATDVSCDTHLNLVNAFGIEGPPGDVRLPYTPEDAQKIQNFMESAPRPWIGVHAGSRRFQHRWPVTHFAKIAKQLHDETGGTLVITTEPHNLYLSEEVAEGLSRAAVFQQGALRWGETQALLAQLDLAIGNESTILQLARGVSTPVLAVLQSDALDRAAAYYTPPAVAISIDTEPAEAHACAMKLLETHARRHTESDRRVA